MYRGCEFFFCNVFELLQVIDERPHSGPGLEEQASLLYAWPQRPFSWPPLSASSLSAGAVLRVQDQALLRSSRSSSCSTRRSPPRRSRCPVGYRKFFPDHYEVSRLLAQKGRCPRLTHSYISNIDVVMIVTVRSRLNTQKVSLCQGLRSAYGKDK